MATIKRTQKKLSAGRRPKSADPDQCSRSAILAAARTVFARRGFDGTTTREVAAIAQVNNAMIYYHFRDKTGLYRAVLAYSFEQFDHIWGHKIFASSASARRKIGKYIEEFIRFQHRNDELRRIMSMEFAACGENCKWLADQFFTRGYARLALIIKEGVRRGELKKVDTATAIPLLIGMIIHSFILRPIAEYVTRRKIALSPSTFGRFVTDLFFDGLGAGKNIAGPNKRQGMGQ